MEISSAYTQKMQFDFGLSDDVKKSALEIISKYDSENFTKDDLKAMREELLDAGISNFSDAMPLLRKEGFVPGYAKEEEEETEQTATSEANTELWELYEDLQNGEITEEDFRAKVINQVSTGSLVDLLS